MVAHGYEPGLVKQAYNNSWGIFACEEHMMLTDGDDSVEVGPGEASGPRLRAWYPGAASAGLLGHLAEGHTSVA